MAQAAEKISWNTDELRFFLTEEARQKGVSFCSPRDGDAGFDIRSCEEVVIASGEQVLIKTGLHLAIPRGWVGLIRDRSSMAVRRLYSHGGVIDSGYRGEVLVVLENGGEERQIISIGDRVAQVVIVPHMTIGGAVSSIEHLGKTPRGDAGFGSTGQK
jgi:dUTP pyrophosphatase